MLTKLFNGIAPDDFLVFVIYAIIGVLVSIGSQYYDHANVIKAHGGFKAGIWFKENFKRYMFGAVALFLGLVFYSDYTGGSVLTNFSAFTLGLTLDVLIDRIFNRKK